MERRLYIIRHGKSSWDYEDLDDIYRPLAPRGTGAADAMANRLMEQGTVPGLIFTSPATRALHTALIMIRIWKRPPAALQIHEPLYMASEKEVLDVVAQAGAGVTDLAVFGHNPTFTELANLFLEEPLDNLPTAGVALITLESESWERISRSDVKKTRVDTPKR